MEPVPLEVLEASADAYDAVVAVTPDVDRFCASSAWILPAHRALMPPRRAWVRRSEAGWLVLARGIDPQLGPFLQPFEAVWGFAAPVAGPDPVALARDVAGALRAEEDAWAVALFSGLVRGSTFFDALVRRLAGRGRLGVGHEVARRRASLEGGLDGFLSRRSPRFRANVRRARRRARERGVGFETVDPRTDPEAFFERVQAVERRSWKGIGGVGIEAGAMHAFYHRMIPRLVAQGSLRGRFAVLDGEDVAYVFGAVEEGIYRGLQTSYDHRFERLSLGAVIQLELIEGLAAEGASIYDMGQDIDYKARWTESVFTTTTLVVIR